MNFFISDESVFNSIICWKTGISKYISVEIKKYADEKTWKNEDWDLKMGLGKMTEIIKFSSEIGRKLTIRTFKNIEYSSRYWYQNFGKKAWVGGHGFEIEKI